MSSKLIPVNAYTLGHQEAQAFYGVKLAGAKLRLHQDEEMPHDGPGNRGTWRNVLLKAKKKEIGELGYVLHPEGHAEIKSFFIDEPYQGKGYGQQALQQILDQHGHVLSDTRTGTTGDAQRAFKALLAKLPNVTVKDLKAKEIGGGKYTDMNDDPTSIWYARKNDVPGLSDENLDDINHNAMYHRRRQGRAFTGAGVGAAAGMLAPLLFRQHIRIPGLSVVGGIAGAIGGGMATNKLQHMWDAAHNLKGDW